MILDLFIKWIFYIIIELECEAGKFNCDGKCQQQEIICDGNNDCADGKDEQNCTCGEVIIKISYTCAVYMI